jgi:tRNA G18 (ribose-2'-O)-methylase SpoU
MPDLIAVHSLDDPRVAPYRELVHSRDARASGLLISEGEKLTQRLLESPFETVSVLLAERLVERVAPTLPEGVPVYVVGEELIREIVGFNFHRGVMACGRRRLPWRWEDLLLPRETPRQFVICPEPNDPENLGGIIRSALAFGVDALAISNRLIDPFSRRVLRVSMGAAFRLPIIESDDLLSFVRRLPDDWGVTTFATVLDDEAAPLHTVEPPPRWALVLGGEGEGLSAEWIAGCRRRTTIPMRRGVDSLNVSVAAGVFLHHFTR